MSLNVETGSGANNSESYASVADADAYLAARGQTNWASVATGDKEAALRRATDYMQSTYSGSWRGYRVYTTQALDWPRHLVPIKDYQTGCVAYYDPAVIPVAVKNACIELALRAAAGDLAPDLGPQEKSVKVGPIEQVFADGARQTPAYQAVNKMLSAFFCGSSNTIKLVRA
jgi:hypothetical protein